MTARRITARARLEASRARGPLGWLLAGWPLALGAVAAALGYRSGGVAWPLAIGLGGATLVVLGGPWALFWRADAAALARLPIGGRVHLRVGLMHAARRAALFIVGTAIAAAPALVTPDAPDFEPALRTLALCSAALACAALAGPSSALLGGALLAAPQASRTNLHIMEPGGPPPTQLLPLIPSIAASILLVATLAAVPWVARGKVPLWVPYRWAPFALLTMLATVLTVAARAAAPGWYRRAWLAIIALDRARPIWIERTSAGPLEAAWGRLMTHAGTLTLYRKDITNLRRRYPAAYAASGAGMIALIAVGIWVRGEAHVQAVLLLAGGLAVYQVVMAWRALRPPVEHLRLLHMLPLPRSAAMRAKASYLFLRLAICVGLAGVPALLRGPEPTLVGAGLGALIVGSMVAGITLIGRARP